MTLPSRSLKYGLGLLLALYIAGSANSGLVFLKPVVLGSLVDGFGFAPSQAGFIVGIETFGIALGCALLALVGVKWSRRRTAMIGSFTAVLVSLGALYAHSFEWLLAQRLLAGFGCGMVTGVVLSTLSTFPNKDRVFGLYFAFHGMVAAVLLPVVASLVTTHGPFGAYATLALLSAISFACALIRFPTYLQEEGNAPIKGPGIMAPAFLLLLLIGFIYWTGTGAVWAFSERIGVYHGFTPVEVGSVLGISHISSLAGALTASLVALRFGRVVPLAATVALTVGSLVLMWLSDTIVMFGAGNLGFNFGVLAFTTYATGTLATYDPSGRLVLLNTVTMTLGLAAGPSIGGIVASGINYNAVLWIGALCHLLAIAIMVPLVIRLRLNNIVTPAANIEAELRPATP